MNPFVAIIWWVTLVGTLFAGLPNLISWLERVLAAARHIERYSEEILAAGTGIAGNTSNAAALKETLSLAPQLVSSAASIENRAASIERSLVAASRRSRQNPQEGQA